MKWPRYYFTLSSAQSFSFASFYSTMRTIAKKRVVSILQSHQSRFSRETKIFNVFTQLQHLERDSQNYNSDLNVQNFTQFLYKPEPGINYGCVEEFRIREKFCSFSASLGGYSFARYVIESSSLSLSLADKRGTSHLDVCKDPVSLKLYVRGNERPVLTGS